MKFTIEYRKRDVARAFGFALRATRVECGISQEKLSEICDFDRTYPSLLERGLRCPTVHMLLRLADALAIEPAQLITAMVDKLRTEIERER